MPRRKTALGAALLLAALAVIVGSAPASTPPTSAVAVPTTVGQTVTDTWTGTIPIGSVNPASTCDAATPVTEDTHAVTVTVPANVYTTLRAEFTFSIEWTPTTNINVNDEILSVYASDGTHLGSSDGGSPREVVVLQNLPQDTYTVVACGFVNASAQFYNGKLEVKTFPLPANEPGLPSAPPLGFEFSAAVAADNQRDESEPLMEIDLDGNIYTCGPTGFSNVSDYAQVSTDGGDQFHLLGTPPRGQQGSGGGGDCGLGTGILRNAQNKYQYAYTGLGPLTGFTTSTSPDTGASLLTGGPQGAGVTSNGGGADRQWQTFIDADSVLLIYNQQAPRNVVVQRSDDGGLIYGPIGPIAAPNPRFPGPIRYNQNFNAPFPAAPPGPAAQGLVYFPWEGTGNSVNLSVSANQGATWFSCQVADASGNLSLFAVADHDAQGNIYVVYTDSSDRHTYLVTVPVGAIGKCTKPAASGQPTTNPGSSTPLQVDRDNVKATVFPWVAAGGAAGRVVVTFHGTETPGNPDLGTFKATWHVYANQSLNALDPAARTFSQVKATTHPFHYDSICLQGLGCTLTGGDRSLADFYAIDYNPVNGKVSIVFNRANKKPDELEGHIATPMVTTQIAGPSNNGGTITLDPARAVVRTSSADPELDALARYSFIGVNPGRINEPAMDFKSAVIGPELAFPAGTVVANGGFTITLTLKDLSAAALTQAMVDTQSQSLLWIWRFTNGYQDAAASARYSTAGGFTFGFNDYTTGTAPCAASDPIASPSEKCIVYPGTTALPAGKVDQVNGTIQISVPRSLLRALSGPEGPGQRPSEIPATAGSRLYDGTAFSLGNTISPVQTLQTFLYPFDNTPSKDFLVPTSGPTAVTLRSFTAVRGAQGVTLRWRTAAEVGNLGFNVYRSVSGRRTKLNARLIRSTASGTAKGHAYAYRTGSSKRGTRYFLQEVHLNGGRVLHGPVSAR